MPALSCHPAGAVRIRVTLEPAEKSPFAPSEITILPRVVHCGAMALAALSAEMLDPPAAVVILTLAFA